MKTGKEKKHQIVNLIISNNPELDKEFVSSKLDFFLRIAETADAYHTSNGKHSVGIAKAELFNWLIQSEFSKEESTIICDLFGQLTKDQKVNDLKETFFYKIIREQINDLLK